MIKHALSGIVLGFAILSCSPLKEYKTTGAIDRLDPALDNVISVDAKIEVLGEGYTWSEGPVWVEKENMLLFSDVPQDTVYKWTEKNGVEVYLTPSGYTGQHPEVSRERGANGLLINAEGKLVLCQHGDRRMAMMDAPLDKPAPKYITLADHYKDKRFDSPNDAVFDKLGNLYFTDPPYGLKKMDKDSLKEIAFQGVYKRTYNGKVLLLIDSITRPNGIALTPDQKFLYVTNSDDKKAIVYRYELSDTSVAFGKIFHDFTPKEKDPIGVPDGLKVNSHGILFTTGPGGIWILNGDGKILGQIKLTNATANCALSTDEKILYMTSDSQLLRVKLK